MSPCVDIIKVSWTVRPLIYRPKHKRRPLRQTWLGVTVVICLISGLLAAGQATKSTPAVAALGAPTGTWTADPNGDVTTTGWTKSGGSNFYSNINDNPDASGSSYVYGPNVTNTNNAIIFDTVNTPSDYSGITAITVNAYAKLTSAGVDGSNTDTQTLAPLITNSSGASLVATATGQALTSSWALYTWSLNTNGYDLSSTTWNAMRVKLQSTYAAVGSGDTTSYVSIASVNVSITYRVKQGSITQAGYIFENDDGTSDPDADTAQAAGNTAITGVYKGERVNVRTQLYSGTNAESANAALFYDRNDGYWSKVTSNTQPITTSGTCADTNFNCTAIDTAANIDKETSVAVDSYGHPWISYYDNVNDRLKVATYVGSGGSGCAISAWTCTTVTSAGTDYGRFNSIAIDSANNVWVSYYDMTNSRLMVAENVAGSGCAVSNWTCTTVMTGVNMGPTEDHTSIVIGPGNRPWVAFESNHDGYVVQYAGEPVETVPRPPGLDVLATSIAVTHYFSPWHSVRRACLGLLGRPTPTRQKSPTGLARVVRDAPRRHGLVSSWSHRTITSRSQ